MTTPTMIVVGTISVMIICTVLPILVYNLIGTILKKIAIKRKREEV